MLIIEKAILILVQGITDGSDETAMTAETECSINLLNNKKKLLKPILKWKQQLFICEWNKNLSKSSEIKS